jgi:uncharacterized membrane protein
MTDEAEFHALLARRARWPALFRIVHARPRLFLCAVAGIALGFALPMHMRDATRALIGWNVTVLLYLALTARMIARANPASIRRNAKFQDEGRGVILFMAALTACASFGAIVAELGPVKSMEGWTKSAHLGLTFLTLVDSWLFIHLIFALHYAHEYYLERRAAGETAPAEARGGLIFPGGAAPHYIDFIYFSFVIGVACQTADVSTASPTMRALALAQGTLAFFYNLAILGLTVNIASGFV